MASELGTAETSNVVATLNRILELELAGLVRYLHYSFMAAEPGGRGPGPRGAGR
jgi:bacterioferritin (cytochrome b1)